MLIFFIDVFIALAADPQKGADPARHHRRNRILKHLQNHGYTTSRTLEKACIPRHLDLQNLDTSLSHSELVALSNSSNLATSETNKAYPARTVHLHRCSNH